MKRLFLAIELPDLIREKLVKLRERRSRFNWVAPRNLHLTLKFIGDIDESLEEPIIAALDVIRVQDFLLNLEGVGYFPPRGHPSVLWAGAGKAHPHLFQLHKAIDDALFQQGFEPEKRAYHPHVTLARVRDASRESVRQFVKRHEDFGTPPFRVDSFGLFSSDLQPGGPIYTLEKRWPLLPSFPPDEDT